MEKKHYCNRIFVDISMNGIAAINRDFYILKFEEDKDIDWLKHTKSSALDILKYQIQALSIAHLGGKQFYALFHRKDYENVHQLEAKVGELLRGIAKESAESITIKHIQITPSFMSGKHMMDNKRHLGQLLFNALPVLRAESAEFMSNAAGKLYQIVGDKAKTFTPQGDAKPCVKGYQTVNIQLDWLVYNNFLCLSLNVQAFTNWRVKHWLRKDVRHKPDKEFPFFVVDPDTRTMRRTDFREKDVYASSNTVFVPYQIADQRKPVPLFDASSWDKFRVTKAGILYKFNKQVAETLGQYLKIEFDKAESGKQLEEQFNGSLSDKVAVRLKSFFNRYGELNIVDIVNDETSADLAEKISTQLKALDLLRGCNVRTSPTLVSGKPNIRLLHNANYYEDKRLKDPKNDLNPDDFVQDLTIESLVKTPKKGVTEVAKDATLKPALENILKELYIKQDIFEQKITICEWKQEGEWLFVTKAEDVKDADFVAVRIKSTGSLYFMRCAFDALPKDEVFQEAVTEWTRSKKRLECIMVAPDGGINFIEHTKLLVYPDVFGVGDKLMDFKEKKFFTNTELTEIFDDFLNTYPKFQFAAEYKAIGAKWAGWKAEIEKKELIDLLKNVGDADKKQKKIAPTFATFFEKKTGISLVFGGRDKKSAGLTFPLNINYTPQSKEMSYYVGQTYDKDRPVKQTVVNASHVRKLTLEHGDILYDKELLSWLNVDFVKHKDLTVLPYPVKYLREWVKSQSAEKSVEKLVNEAV